MRQKNQNKDVRDSKDCKDIKDMKRVPPDFLVLDVPGVLAVPVLLFWRTELTARSPRARQHREAFQNQRPFLL